LTASFVQQVSLSDPPPVSAITSAVTWVSDLVFGPLATIIAVIAVAWVGFAMLSGRIEIRRGLSVIFGCFLLFGAREIARDLRSTALSETVPVSANVPPPPPFAKPPSAANAPSGYDPYAGASVKQYGE
jgi:type IV secretion system protein VirB2